MLIDFEGSNKSNVANVIAAKVNVHQSWNLGVAAGIFVVLNSLNKGGGAVSDSSYCDLDTHGGEFLFDKRKIQRI